MIFSHLKHCISIVLLLAAPCAMGSDSGNSDSDSTNSSDYSSLEESSSAAPPSYAQVVPPKKIKKKHGNKINKPKTTENTELDEQLRKIRIIEEAR